MTTLLVLFVGLGAANAWADTLVYWIGPTGLVRDGNWSTAAYWSGGVAPNNGGGVTYSVTLPYYYQYYVTLDMSPTVNSVTLNSNANLWVDPSQTLTAVINNLGFGGGGPSYIYLNSNSTLNGTVNNSSVIELLGPNAAINGTVNNNGDFGFVGITTVGTTTVTGTFNNSAGGNVFVGDGGVLTASYYHETGGTTDIDYGGVMNVKNGTTTVTGGWFQMGASGNNPRAVLNGNLEIAGGTFYAWDGLVNGNLTFTPTGTFLRGQIGLVDMLAVTGDASLAGTLNLDFCRGCTPPGVYTIMTYAAETGEFGTVISGLPPWQTYSLDYGATALDVVITGPATPESTSLLLMGTGLLALAYRFRR